MQPEDNSSLPYAIPYDFDFSAFVDAKYTIPPGVPDDILTSRKVYMGICFTRYELKVIFELYRKLRPSFESIITKQKAVSSNSKKQLLHFLEDFYTVIDNDQLVKQVFSRDCPTGY
jgi:hypothetical protein